MIMPCMNSISACEGRGNVGLAEAGSVLLRIPGAPGCTTTEVDCATCCCVSAGAKGHVAKSTPARAAIPVGDLSLGVRGLEQLLSLCVSANIFSLLTLPRPARSEKYWSRVSLKVHSLRD